MFPHIRNMDIIRHIINNNNNIYHILLFRYILDELIYKKILILIIFNKYQFSSFSYPLVRMHSVRQWEDSFCNENGL